MIERLRVIGLCLDGGSEVWGRAIGDDVRTAAFVPGQSDDALAYAKLFADAPIMLAVLVDVLEWADRVPASVYLPWLDDVRGIVTEHRKPTGSAPK